MVLNQGGGRGSFAHYLKINADADEPALDRVTIFCKPPSTGFLLLPEIFSRFSATIKLGRFCLSLKDLRKNVHVGCLCSVFRALSYLYKVPV